MLTINDILLYTKGCLLSGNPNAKISGVSTDTRNLKKGELFVALQGKNFNGHKFIKLAIEKKASAVLISDKSVVSKVKIPVIYCSDTLKAYCDIARGYRSKFSIPVIAITGSVGKTTTKELIAKVLSKHFCLLKNYQTENNEIGVAKTLLKIHPRHEVAVLEFGTNHFGEIDRLAHMGRPTAAVLTNIGDSHLEFLKNRQGVFREKSDIFREINNKGNIIYNNDDPRLRTIHKKRLLAHTITFAIDSKA
ncbi:MAG: UDP-N-acetylmuramoyl-tripeptide--D-alanyl-D-alanine ligase, partial [Candidatus Omnitrophica bacterium]|nr:UDP-N-acetylmuramoyl-tripeptide--D-alanyl-D-alanine ligase [Candidatus Omnitrophota bacterium]